MGNKLPLTVAFSALVAGLGAFSVQAQEMKMELGAGEGVVDIVAWPGYIERGETDPAFDWVTDFE